MLLTEEPDVEWWEQMVEKRRVKRDKDESIPSWDSFNVNEKPIHDSITKLNVLLV